MLRVRDRLANHGMSLELHMVDGGWRWAIAGPLQRVSQVFGSLHLALYHADAHTALSLKEPPLAAYTAKVPGP
jgi:hypothetical protein